VTISMDQLTGWVAGFLWPFFRVAAVMTVAPVLGVRTTPLWLRIGISAAITVVIVPLLPPGPAVDPASADGLLITLSQIAIGLAIGFVARMAFGALETAGALIGQSMGLGFAQMMDPANGVEVPVVSQFYTLMATLVFLALNGHLVLIEFLVESFRVIPIAPQSIGEQGLWRLLSWAGWIFKGAVIVSLPIVAALLLVNIAFGVMTRAAPQLNLFAIGFPVSLMLGFVFMFISLPLFAPQFSELMNQAFIGMRAILEPVHG
jgi:flagellar biosynthetic protein FliR